MNDSMSLCFTRTCLFTEANDRSHKCSTGTYRETPIVPTSCTKHTQWGQSKGHREQWTRRTHTVHWAQTHLFYPLQNKDGDREVGRTRKGRGEERRGERGVWGFTLIFKYKRTCTNRIASRHYAPIFTVIVTGSGTTPWQDHPFEICR